MVGGEGGKRDIVTSVADKLASNRRKNSMELKKEWIRLRKGYLHAVYFSMTIL
jgi:hypothetical protein